MSTLASDFPVASLARTLGISRATQYRNSSKGQRALEDAQLSEHIARIFLQHKQRYGSPRIHLQLQQEGFHCGVNRVARLMRQAGWVAKMPRRKCPRTTDSRHSGPIAANHLKKLHISRANQAWAMDITYIPLGGRWAYLAAVLDLHLHKIVGWEISESLHADVACTALKHAQQKQGYPAEVLVHSDRGIQYASKEFISLCTLFGCKRSMSAKGNCYDNATMESFFGVLKREELNEYDFESIEEVRAQVFEYIETYYNRVRIHTALGMSPLAFERAQGAAPSAEFSEAWETPKVGKKEAEEQALRPRPMVVTSSYPSASCSPAEPASVSPDITSIHQEPLVIKH